MRAEVEITIPDIGDFDEVAVIEVLVKPGDTVKAEQSLITVESDKASMEIPSSHAGVVKDVKVKVGDKVSQGSAIVSIEATGAAPALQAAAKEDAPVAQPAPAPSKAQAEPSRTQERVSPTAALPAHEPTAPQGPLPHASPSIRKLAR